MPIPTIHSLPISAPFRSSSPIDEEPLSVPLPELDYSDQCSDTESEITDVDYQNDLSDVDLYEDRSSNASIDKLAVDELRNRPVLLLAKFNSLYVHNMALELSRNSKNRSELLEMMHQVLALEDTSESALNAKMAIVQFATAQDFDTKSDIFNGMSIYLAQTDLRDLDFSGINLSRANFSDAYLSDSNFSDANLYGANFHGAKLIRTNLRRTNLSFADLSESDLTDAFLDAYLIRTNLDNAILTGVDLSVVSVAHVQLRKFTMGGEIYEVRAKNPEPDLVDHDQDDDDEGVPPDERDLYTFSMEWSKTSLNGDSVDFNWPEMFGENSNDPFSERISFIETSWSNKRYCGTDVSHCDFTGSYLTAADFRGANAYDSDFRGADLSKANFGIDLVGNYLTFRAFRRALTELISKSPNLKIVNAGHSDFRYARLVDVNFKAVNLINANFGNADLRRANFIGADLRGVNFRGADLKGATFAMANLSGVDFSGMDLRGIDFSGADLTGANFSGARMDGAILRNANLRGIRIDPINLARAVVTGANFSDFNFRGMDLTGVKFDAADMRGANLQGATLNRTSFKGANLTDAYYNVTEFRLAYTESRIELNRTVFNPGCLESIITPVIQPKPLIIENPVNTEQVIPHSAGSIPRTSLIVQRNIGPEKPVSSVHRHVVPPPAPVVVPKRQSVWSWLSDVPIWIGGFFRSIFLGMFRPR